YAVDGDTGTFWQSASAFMSSPQWLMVDLGTLCHVSSVTLTDRVGYTLGFDVYISQTDQAGLEGNDASFIKVGAGTNSQMEVTFGAQSARYIKINVTSILGVSSGYLNSYSATISDIEVK
ncbi:MAG: discoidin domain-containing protein, partial [Alistipes sp.]|nr:discoidin domain-containing protein [Alistipes sp.]